VRTKHLKLQKNFTQTLCGDFFAELTDADFVVLTINTPEITAAEKNGPRTLLSAYAGFFPKVKGGSCYFRILSCSAKT
jgi:hypothetical protein